MNEKMFEDYESAIFWAKQWEGMGNSCAVIDCGKYAIVRYWKGN